MRSHSDLGTSTEYSHERPQGNHNPETCYAGPRVCESSLSWTCFAYRSSNLAVCDETALSAHYVFLPYVVKPVISSLDRHSSTTAYPAALACQCALKPL